MTRYRVSPGRYHASLSDLVCSDIGTNIGICRHWDQMSQYRVIQFQVPDIAHDVSCSSSQPEQAPGPGQARGWLSGCSFLIWNPHTWKFRGIYLVYPRVMTMYVVTQGYTRYIDLSYDNHFHIPGIYPVYICSMLFQVKGI